MTAMLTLVLLAAGGTELDDERAQLQERLEAENAAFEALGTQRKSLLTLLDTLERLARESADRAGRLDRALRRVTKQAAEAQQNLEQALRAQSEQQRRLAPRLVALYRLQRRDALGDLLSASDFAALVKRQRSLQTLVSSDLAALDELALLSAYAKGRAHRLERLEATAERYQRALRGEQAVGQARLQRFKELLGSVTAEQGRMGRLVAELEASERELATMVAELAPSAQRAGLRSRKGQLPFPTTGIVEVGFGKVVNPRFNTVTVQKGIDVRAAAGAEVVSVGEGTVVYAGWLKGYGTLVIVDHGSGYHSLYAHLADSQVEVGNVVEEGEAIGSVGETGSLKGPYLYFEIRKGGEAIDPQPWLKQE